MSNELTHSSDKDSPEMKEWLPVFTAIITCSFLLFSLSASALASPAKAVSEGNRLYHQEKYDEAIKKYSEARSEVPDSDIVNFDLGTALYKSGRYREAIEAFTKAIVTKDKSLEAKTTYNIANSRYKLGSQQENTDPNSAAALYRESLDYYKRTMELDKNDQDAKYNHDLVEKRLEALLEKLKNKPQQKQQGDQGQNQKDDHGDGGTQNKQGSKQQIVPENRQAKEGDEKDRDSGQREKTGAGERDAGGAKNKTMSPEEARMLLDAYRTEEAGSVSDRERHGFREEVLKDW